MNIRKTEAIVLNSCDFKDYDKILTVFGADTGILKLIVKGANRNKKRQTLQIYPSATAEFLYLESEKELKKCQEITVIQPRLELRQSFAHLQAGFEMIQLIARSYKSDVPSPALYKLLNLYLNYLPKMLDPNILSASFKLKFLRHEGLLGFKEVCSTCQQPLKETHFYSGEFYCDKDAPLGSISLDEESFQLFMILAFCQNFPEIQQLQLPQELHKTIGQIPLSYN